MTGEERALRDEICRLAEFDVPARADRRIVGKLSARLPDGFLTTPTNSCLGFLEAARLSKLDPLGAHVAGDPPTKEVPLHLALTEARPQAGGVVHLHSTYATALSCLADTDPEDAIPAITPYVVMRVGRVPLIPYTRPGSAEVAPLIAARAREAAAVLLANHGPVVLGAEVPRRRLRGGGARGDGEARAPHPRHEGAPPAGRGGGGAARMIEARFQCAR